MKVGLGAHAEIGYSDGKFKVDIGASLGLGIDIGFEVDMTGVVNGVSEAVDAVADFASSAWENTKSFISDVGDGISNFFGNLF